MTVSETNRLFYQRWTCIGFHCEPCIQISGMRVWTSKRILAGAPCPASEVCVRVALPGAAGSDPVVRDALDTAPPPDTVPGDSRWRPLLSDPVKPGRRPPSSRAQHRRRYE